MGQHKDAARGASFTAVTQSLRGLDLIFDLDFRFFGKFETAAVAVATRATQRVKCHHGISFCFCCCIVDKKLHMVDRHGLILALSRQWLSVTFSIIRTLHSRRIRKMLLSWWIDNKRGCISLLTSNFEGSINRTQQRALASVPLYRWLLLVLAYR